MNVAVKNEKAQIRVFDRIFKQGDRLNENEGINMKYITMIAALIFSASSLAMDCAECHENLDIQEHVEMEATMKTCNDCHDMGSAHELDPEIHAPDLTIKECADCHE